MARTGRQWKGRRAAAAASLGLLTLAAAGVCGQESWAQDAQGTPSSKPVKEIRTTLTNGTGQPAGTAVFQQRKKGVEVKIALENVPFGEHGVHIHQNAVCEGPDFKSAGGHFNPDGKQHGYQNPMGHHKGDLPGNVSVGEDHHGSAKFLLTDVTLQPGAPNSLLSNQGTALIVHEKADDMKTDPSGASGNRIACGVIKQP